MTQVKWSKESENVIRLKLVDLFNKCIFSPTRAGAVIELPCPSVCLCVCVLKVVIINYGQTVRVIVTFYKIEG